MGFYLKTVDGFCFDGVRFRKCHADSNFLWGVGVNFSSKGELTRTLYKFHNPSMCLLEDSVGSLALGDCQCQLFYFSIISNAFALTEIIKKIGSSRQAHRWGLKEGKLSRDNGKICVVRTIDNFGATRLCIEGFEYFTPEIPEVSTIFSLVSKPSQKLNFNCCFNV